MAIAPQGLYSPATRHGDLIFSAGMTPRCNGEMLFEGPVAAEADPRDYRDAVILASRNPLAAVKSQLAGEWVSKIVNLTIYIAAEPGFRAHSKIADFGSEYLDRELGTSNPAARAGVGVASLPGNAALELQLIVAVSSRVPG